MQEIYVDEEDFPEMFAFVWGAVGNEEDFAELLEDNPFGLPTGQFGPVRFYRGFKLVNQEIARLGSLDYDSITLLSNADYSEEVAAILEVLQVAKQTDQGVFIFWFE